jgi:hypothetical protein
MMQPYCTRRTFPTDMIHLRNLAEPVEKPYETQKHKNTPAGSGRTEEKDPQVTPKISFGPHKNIEGFLYTRKSFQVF